MAIDGYWVLLGVIGKATVSAPLLKESASDASVGCWVRLQMSLTSAPCEPNTLNQKVRWYPVQLNTAHRGHAKHPGFIMFHSRHHKTSVPGMAHYPCSSSPQANVSFWKKKLFEKMWSIKTRLLRLGLKR